MNRRFIALAVLAIAAHWQAAHAQTVANALGEVNRVRAARGLYPLAPHRAMQAQAESEATIRASRRITGHLRNGCSPGRAEGVGWSGRRDPYGQQFLTCFHAPGDYTRRYREAGAAVAVSPRGQSFYVLVLR